MGESTALLANWPGRESSKENHCGGEGAGGAEGTQALGGSLGIAFGQENQVQIPQGDREEGTNLSGEK